MQRHFHTDLRHLQQKLLEMSFYVEEAIVKACDALFDRDMELAKEVLEGEEKINLLEIEIDEKGHALFALGQPMAVDLRAIMMMLKINTDLERIGDHAVNLAESCQRIIQEPPAKIDIPLEAMTTAAQKMLRQALDAFIKEDVNLAQAVLKGDDEIDRIHRENFPILRKAMESNPSLIGIGMNYIMISSNLERIADLANNIAEDVIYWKNAKEVRHHIGQS